MNEDAELILLEAEEKMEKSASVLKEELMQVRTGRAHPGLLEHVRVNYYGEPTALNKLANVSAPEARMLVVQPFDPATTTMIMDAIRVADMGFNPQSSDGRIVRVPIPDLSQERRRDLTRHVKKLGEEAKIAIRNVRRDSNESIKAIDGISEDDVKRLLENVQKVTDTHVASIDTLVTAKEKDLMTV